MELFLVIHLIPLTLHKTKTMNIHLLKFNHAFVIYEITDIDGVNYWLKRGAQLIETFCIGELLAQ